MTNDWVELLVKWLGHTDGSLVNGIRILTEESLENTLDFSVVRMKSDETACESGSELCLDTEPFGIWFWILIFHNCDK